MYMLKSLVVLFLLGSMMAQADLMHYQARIRGQQQSNLLDIVQAKTMAEARNILAARHGDRQFTSVRRLDPEAGYSWFVARITLDGQNATDTTLAKNSGEARRVFTGRYPKGRIVSLYALRDTSEYGLYESTIHPNGKTVRDVVLADGPTDARKAFEIRYPGARLGSIRSRR